MPAAATPEGAAFAALLRQARTAAGRSQDDVAERNHMSRRTYSRWERGHVESPDPLVVAEVCRDLGINPIRAAIALGMATQRDLDLLIAEQLQHEPLTAEVLAALTSGSLPEPAREAVRRVLAALLDTTRLLDDPAAADGARAALAHVLTQAVQLWRAAVTMPEPAEPGRGELSQHQQHDSARP